MQLIDERFGVMHIINSNNNFADIVIGKSKEAEESDLNDEVKRIMMDNEAETTVIDSRVVGTEPSKVMPVIYSAFVTEWRQKRVSIDEVSLVIIIADLDVMLDKACVFEVGMYMAMLEEMITNAGDASVSITATARDKTVLIENLLPSFYSIDVYIKEKLDADAESKLR